MLKEIKSGPAQQNVIDEFWKDPCERTLYSINKRLQTPEMLEAVLNNDKPNDRYFPLLRIVSKKLITRSVCERAVLRDDLNFHLIPEEYLDKQFYEYLIEHHGSLKIIPKKYLTQEACEDAVKNNWAEIEYVPSKYKSEALCLSALEQNPNAIMYIPKQFINDRWALLLVSFDGLLLRYIPAEIQNNTIVEAAVAQNPLALKYVPPEKKTRDLCDKVFLELKDMETLPLIIFPKEYRKEYKKQHEEKAPVLHTQPLCLAAGETGKKAKTLKTVQDKSFILHNVSLNESEKRQLVYYISDLHLEHQLNLDLKPFYKIREMLANRIRKLLLDVSDRQFPLLIAGDVSDGCQLTNMFLEELRKQWSGKIIFVSGNHEIADVYSNRDASVDMIISGIKAVSARNDYYTLENELLVFYKGLNWNVIPEAEILNASQDKLKSICSKSVFLVLGGNGFSGCNPIYNADYGLYRGKLSRNEEIARSARFRRVHDKLLSCIEETRLIVLTHTPPNDWTTGKLNPHWIYVSGHTHINETHFTKGEVCLIADNQVGYKRHPWTLKSFEYESALKYDPLAGLLNGIHEITAHEYEDFMRCSGMPMSSFKRLGQVYALKHDGYYMFFLDSYILSGGLIRKAAHNKQYYYENIPLYVSTVKKLFSRYYESLKKVSAAVKKLGGTGRIHGSIVDLDFCNHLFVNPYDGTVKSYFAKDMVQKLFYETVDQLIEHSPYLNNRKVIAQKYNAEFEIRNLLNSPGENSVRAIPELVLDTEMYKTSRHMLSVQYVLENNVIRFWRDEILTYQSDYKFQPDQGLLLPKSDQED